MDENRCSRCANHICASKVPIFSSLDSEDLKRIVQMTGHTSYKKGDYLCREGDRLSKLFIINEGRVKLSKVNKEGKEQILRILSTGAFFGEYYLFSDHEAYNFSAIAVSEVKICSLTKNDMDQIMKDYPDINYKILAEISRLLMHTENLAQNLSTMDTESKVAFVLMELAEHYGKPNGNRIEIEMPINREEMANYAGVSRETMSRKLTGFEKEGIIKAKGYKVIIIKDKDALSALI